MSTFRRRLVVASSDSKYAIVKCYNDTFDLSCLTDGIAEYLDTYGDTQYIAGSATGTINVYHDSEVRITKASGINSQSVKSIESKGINFVLKNPLSTGTIIDISIEKATFTIDNANWNGSWFINTLSLKDCPIQSITEFNNTTRTLVKILELSNCSNLTIFKTSIEVQSTYKQYFTNDVVLTDCPLLNVFSIYGYKTTNAYNNLQTFTITNCPNLNKIALNGYQYIGANFDNSANFFAFLRNLPTRANNDGEIYIGYMGNSNTADNIMIDGITMRTYLANKGWTYTDTEPSWAR